VLGALLDVLELACRGERVVPDAYEQASERLKSARSSESTSRVSSRTWKPPR
jgi:hypothetical protein